MSTTTEDPRRSLPTNAAGIDRTESVAVAQYINFSSTAPVESAAGATWTTRGQNAVLKYVAARSEATIFDGTFGSETALILASDAAAVKVVWNGAETVASGHGLVVIPAGDVSITNTGSGDVVLLVRADEPGWSVQTVNAAAYAEDHPRVAPAIEWPEPIGGDKVRIYYTKDIQPEPGRFGRIFRTRSFMVNFLPTQSGPRDPAKLSPHYHDDFEQYSLATAGSYTHHIRTPWLVDQAQWIDDEHESVGAPSIAIIPPPTIHTSAATGAGDNILIDIFSPPREDFSAKTGWVLNAEDYPQP